MEKKAMSITDEFKRLFNADALKKHNDNIGYVLNKDDFYLLAEQEFKNNCNVIMRNNFEKFKNNDYDYHHDENGKCVENWYDEYEDNIIQYYMKELCRVYDVAFE